MTIEKTCPYKFLTKRPPCIILRAYKSGNLTDFLEGLASIDNEYMISHSLDCIDFKDNYIEIINENCINCMYCVFGCPGNNIEISSIFKLKTHCSNFESNLRKKFADIASTLFFNGKFIDLPKIRLSHFKIKYNSFKEFTEKEETKNISVWGANALKFLSISSNPRIGLEIGMNIETRDRGARLDIVLLNRDMLFVAESKVSFSSMINENRYLAQMIAYDDEINSTLAKINKKIRSYQFLLIGGSETDLLPPNHPLCTSKVGNQAKIFYRNLIDHDLFFISANALLSLGLSKVFFGDKYSLENIFSKIFVKNAFGLLSSGLVIQSGSEFVLESLHIN